MIDARVQIVRYDPSWVDKVDTEKAMLEDLLAPWRNGPIEHVGSTGALRQPPVV